MATLPEAYRVQSETPELTEFRSTNPTPSVTDFISESSFDLVDIDWDAKTFTMSMRGSKGETRMTRTVSR